MRTKMMLAAATVAAGAGVLAVAPAASAAPVPHECRAYYSSFDPDEGAGAGASNCGPMDAIYHRVKLTCSGPSGQYYAYGYWAWSQGSSSTTCLGGHVAYGVTYELR